MGEIPEPSETPTTKTQPATTASSSFTFSIPTSFAFCRNSAKYTAINDAFDGSLYELADPSIIYVSVDEGVVILFWLADLNNEHV